MNSSSVSTPPPPKQKKVAGLDPSKTSTNERAKPVPYLAGVRRLAITWLGPAYNQTTEEVTQQSPGGGKAGGGEDQVVGYDYYADVAGLVCLGPVDTLQEVWMDDERVWRGPLNRSGDSATITIEERGNMTIYWGTSTQPIDSILGAEGHPAYRGQCYVVFNQLYFGQDKQQAPNVELVVARAPDAAGVGGQKWIGSDVNPVHVVAEWVTNVRWGLGLASSTLDIPQLTAAAMKLAGETIGLSPLITEQTSARTLILKLCEYIDAWPSYRNGNLLQLQLNRTPATNTQIYPLVGEYDLTEQPKWGSDPWSSTTNQVAVTFTDRLARYDTDVEEWVSPASQAVVGEPIKEQLDRQWICSRTTAYRVANSYGRVRSVPKLTAKLSIRRNLVDDELRRRGDSIRAGGLLRFTTADFTETLLLRVTRVTTDDDRSQAVHIDAETDRYYSAVLNYVPDDIPGVDDTLGGPHTLIAARVVEVPRKLATDDPGADDITHPNFGFLCVRRSKTDTRVKALVSESGADYRRAGMVTHYAFYGTLHSALNRGTRFDLTASVVLDVPAAVVDRNWPSTTQNRWWNGEIIAFIGNEVMSVMTINVLSGTQVELVGILRCRYGVLFEDHAAGAQVFIVKRLLFTSISKRYLTADDVTDWKLLSGTRFAFQAASEVTAQRITVVNHTTRQIGPTNLVVNGSVLPPYTYASGGNVVIKWNSRHWLRHALWQSFDHPLKPVNYEHRIYFYDSAGTEVLFTKVNDASRVELSDGLFQYTLSNASLITTFGSEPSWFIIRVYSRVRGLLSTDFLEAKVVKTGSGVTSTGSGSICFSPSGLSHVVYTTNPEPLMQANFTAIASHFGLSLLTVAGTHARVARTRSRSNFSTIASALGVTLHDVLGPGKAHPGWVAEANFEIINAHW
jgi:hypothetical protein